jgi:hypothetical protein
MEFTDRYVYINPVNKTAIDAFHIRVDLGPTDSRVPYVMLEVISAALVSTELAVAIYVLKVDELAMNYYSDDFKGTQIGILGFNSLLGDSIPPGTENVFNLAGYSPKVVFGGQVRYLTLSFENGSGEKQLLSTITPFVLSIKCSYPRVDSISNSYRQQIPLPSMF